MQRIRVTQADGGVWTREVRGASFDIGRDASNHIVLPHPAVSARHCLLEATGSAWVVKDRGSSNGTFLNNERLDEPRVFVEGDLLYVGPFLLELVSMAPETGRRLRSPTPRGPMIRVSSPSDVRNRAAVRWLRWAREWDEQGRPVRLLLRGAALRRAIVGARQPGSPLVGSIVFTAFLHASRRKATRERMALALLVAAAVVVLVGSTWIALALRETVTDDVAQEVVVDAPEAGISVGTAEPEAAPAPTEAWIEHRVIPAETLEDVAKRYDVPAANVARWNRLNPDAPELAVGSTLRIKPRLRPLPQQLIVYELEERQDWRHLSERFGVPVQKLRAYNPKLGLDLQPGTQIDVWIDPKPYDRRAQPGKIPEFDIRPDALSVGNPNDGRLVNGIQMPKSELYTMRAPNIMWGSSHTIEQLLTAIARFRQEIDFDGVLVVADLSKRGGGHIPPHKSHQAGRDVDIWMPTLKGVYKRSYLGRERKPQPNEIDWFATWGLIRSLIATEQVLHIFIEYELQEKVYHAAKLMGATDDELAKAMQWPRGPYASGILGHSDGHTGHIHVRFRCGLLDSQCIDSIKRPGKDGGTDADHAD